MGSVLEVNRIDLQSTRLVDDPEITLAQGEVRLAIESFALTTNNVTYAVVGEMMAYWDFFVPTGSGWGRVPVWGYAHVAQSRHPDVVTGQRLFGYLPMASHLVIEAGRIDDSGLSDITAHRQPMASVYNRYELVPASIEDAEQSGMPSDVAARISDRSDALRMLLYPLFVTSYLIADALVEQGPSGQHDGRPNCASGVVVSSASSKTALALAWAARSAGLETIGLTSTRRVEHVEQTGLWDRVLAYDEIDEIGEIAVTGSKGVGMWAYVDIAGSAEVTSRAHRALSPVLVRSISVGITHREQFGQLIPPSALVVAHEPFFAPMQIAKRTAEWGRGVLNERMGESWSGFALWADGWLEIEATHGAPQIASVWRHLVGGESRPQTGYVCAM